MKLIKFTDRIAPAVFAIIIIWMAVIEVQDLNDSEQFPDYELNVRPWLDDCNPLDIPEKRGALKWWYICVSNEMGNERFLPWLFSIGVLVFTYLFITSWTKSKTTGWIAMTVTATSGVFYLFNTTVTYEQSWVFFLLVSLYCLTKTKERWWAMSAPFFLLAVMFKPLPLIYFPMIAFMIYKSDIPRKKKWHIFISHSIVIIFLTGIAVFSLNKIVSVGNVIQFSPDEFLAGLFNWWFYLDTSIIIAMLIPLIIIKLALMAKHKVKTALPILFWIVSLILTVSFIEGFTEQLNHAYRFVPLIIFAGAGLGLIIAQFLDRNNPKFYVKYQY